MKKLISLMLVVTISGVFCLPTSAFAEYYYSGNEMSRTVQSSNELHDKGYSIGFNNGYSDGYKSGQINEYSAYYNEPTNVYYEDSPYNMGEYEGYQDGYVAGYEDGLDEFIIQNNPEYYAGDDVEDLRNYAQQRYDESFDKGYNFGYDNGYDDGYEAGKIDTFEAYYNEPIDGEDSPYNIGERNGYRDGYEDGYSEGIHEYNQNSQRNNRYNVETQGYVTFNQELSEEDYDYWYNYGYNNEYNHGYSDGSRAGQLGSDGAYYNGLADFEVGDSPYNQGAYDGYYIGYKKGFYDYYQPNYSYDTNDEYNDGYNDGYDQGYNDGYIAAELGESYGDDYLGVTEYAASMSIYNKGSFDGYAVGYKDGFYAYDPNDHSNDEKPNTKISYYSYSSSISSDVTINGKNYHYEDTFETNDPNEAANHSYEISVTEQYTPVCEQPVQTAPSNNNYGNSGGSVPSNNSSSKTAPADDLYSGIIYYNNFQPMYVEVTKDCKSHITASKDSESVRSIKKGTILYITGECSNKYNNVWYIINNGNEYIYGGNLTGHKHTIKNVKTEIGTFKICKYCDYCEIPSNSKDASAMQKLAMGGAVALGAGASVADGALPIGDMIGICLIEGVALLLQTGSIPELSDVLEAVRLGRLELKFPGSYRKVERVGEKLKYEDGEYLDMAEAFKRVLAGKDVHCETYSEAKALASMDPRGCFSERDKNKPNYYYHFHIGNDGKDGKKRKTYGGHIFYGETDNGDRPY